LRQVIQIVQPGTTRDSYGGTTPGGGALLATTWASIESLSGRDLLAAQSFSSTVSHVVRTRWLPGVLAKQTIVWQDPSGTTRKFQVEAVTNPDGRSKVLKLFCVEINDSTQQ